MGHAWTQPSLDDIYCLKCGLISGHIPGKPCIDDDESLRNGLVRLTRAWRQEATSCFDRLAAAGNREGWLAQQLVAVGNTYGLAAEALEALLAAEGEALAARKGPLK